MFSSRSAKKMRSAALGFLEPDLGVGPVDPTMRSNDDRNKTGDVRRDALHHCA